MPIVPPERLLSQQDAAHLFDTHQVVELLLYELPPPAVRTFTIGLRLLSDEQPYFIATRRAATSPREWKKADSVISYVKKSFAYRGSVVRLILAAPPGKSSRRS